MATPHAALDKQPADLPQVNRPGPIGWDLVTTAFPQRPIGASSGTAAGVARKWTRQIGIGFSSVSIAEGRLFTMGHIDGREQVFCLNAETGEEIWTHGYGAPLVDNLHEGGPGATPRRSTAPECTR